LLRKYCKEGASVVINFWVPTQKNTKIQKNTYKKIKKIIKNNNIVGRNPKIIGVREGCWNAHKMARNWLRRFKNTRIEI
jgi:hypothetical protein